MIYLDNAATTPMQQQVPAILSKYGMEAFYNPSALYDGAVRVHNELQSARAALCRALGAPNVTLYFTSCGTESDNAALLCTRKRKGCRIIVSAAEHAAVYNSALALSERGFDVVFADVDGAGRVTEESFKRLLTPETGLVSIMHVNNETGAINDIKRLSALAKAAGSGILFHADGVQAFGHIPVNVRALGVDLYSVSGHKIGAPKGVGLLYVRQGLSIAPSLYGGGQESGVRSGTENVGGAVALASCAEKYLDVQGELAEKGREMRAHAQAFADSHTGCMMLSPVDGAPHIVTLAFERVRGEVMMHELEQYGIVVGIGSACSSKKGTARIPKALGLHGGYEMGMVRMSINPFDRYDWDYVFAKMHDVYDKLQKFVRV